MRALSLLCQDHQRDPRSSALIAPDEHRPHLARGPSALIRHLPSPLIWDLLSHPVQVRMRQDPDTAKPWSLADQPLHAVAALLWALLVVDGTQNLVDPSCTVIPKDVAGAGAVLGGGGAPAASKAAPAPKTAPVGPLTPSVAAAPKTALMKDHSNTPFMQAPKTALMKDHSNNPFMQQYVLPSTVACPPACKCSPRRPPRGSAHHDVHRMVVLTTAFGPPFSHRYLAAQGATGAVASGIVPDAPSAVTSAASGGVNGGGGGAAAAAAAAAAAGGGGGGGGVGGVREMARDVGIGSNAAREEAKEEGGRERRETRERVRLIASDCV